MRASAGDGENSPSTLSLWRCWRATRELSRGTTALATDAMAREPTFGVIALRRAAYDS
jgi:hypothetical protein